MTTKVCANRNCSAYAHFVFTVAMRCVLCRCDLMSAQRNAGVVGEARGGARLAESSFSSRAQTHSSRP